MQVNSVQLAWRYLGASLRFASAPPTAFLGADRSRISHLLHPKRVHRHNNISQTSIPVLRREITMATSDVHLMPASVGMGFSQEHYTWPLMEEYRKFTERHKKNEDSEFASIALPGDFIDLTAGWSKNKVLPGDA